jgi:hypothetical protein
MNRRRIAPVLAGVVLAMVGGLTCTDLSGPRTAVTQVGLAPRFTRAAEDALRSLASFDLALDNVRVRLNRGDGTTAVDTVVAVNPGVESVSIELTVRVNGSEEQFNAIIELRAGDLVLFSGTQVVVAKTTGSSSSGPPIEVEYVGPGAGAVDVNVLPGEIAILSNQTAAFTAVAFDASEQQLPDLLVEWTVRDPALGGVSAAGVFTPVAGARGSTWVIATLPTNVKDSAHVTVSPVPTSAVLVAGAGQAGAIAQVLSPFVFEVRAADQLPVSGAEVEFNVASGGGSLSASTGITDGDGHVSVTLTLGALAGENAVQLLFGDALLATATATAGVGLPTSLVLEGGPNISVQAGQSIAAAHSVRVLDVLGNPVPGVPLRLALTTPDAAELLLEVGATSDANGRVFFSALGPTESAGLFRIEARVIEPLGITSVVAQVEVVAGASASLAFITQPPTAQAGAPFTVAVEVRDAQGNVATGFAGAVTIALLNNPTQTTLGGTLTKNAVAGVATFDDLTVNRAATGYTLGATTTGLPSASSVSFTVAAAAPATLVFTAQPGTVGPGLAFTVAVAAHDAFGNVATAFAGSVALAIGNNPASGSLGGTTTTNAVAGVASFTDLSIDIAGVGYTLEATSGALTGTSAPINIVAGFRFTWTNAAGGAWSVGANWDRGTPPGPADTAVIELDGNYSVVLDQSASIASIRIGGTTGQQRLLVSSNTLTIGTLGTFGQTSTLELSGGTIDGPGAIIHSGQFFWTGGTLAGAGSLQTTSGSLTELSGGTKVLLQRFVGIGGNGTWQSGDIFTGGSAQLHVASGGNLTVSGGVGFLYNQGNGISVFVNGGTLTTAGTVTVSGAFTNAGALSVDSGALILSGGGSWVPTSASIADGAAIQFPSGSHALGGDVSLTGGEILVNGGTVAIVGTYSATGLTHLTSGTLSFDPTAPATVGQLVLAGGTLNGGGIVNVTGQFTWSGGRLDGTGTLDVTASATATFDGGTKVLVQRRLAVGGSAAWTSGDIFTGGAAELNVLAGGSLSASGTVGFTYNQGNGASTMTNGGAFVSGGSVSVSGIFNNTGTLAVQSGLLQLGGGGNWSGTQSVTIGTSALLNFNNGTHVLSGGITVSGAGELRVTGASVVITGTLDGLATARVTAGSAAFDVVQPVSVSQLLLQGGTLSGTGTMNVTNQFTWGGGTLRGTGLTQLNLTASASFEAGTKVLLERTLVIGGAATWSSGDIFTGSSAVLSIVSGGGLAVTSNVAFAYNQGNGISTLANAGAITTSGIFNVTGVFNNSGTLGVTGALMALGGGGTWSGTTPVTIGTGAALTFSGGVHTLASAFAATGTGEVVFGGATVAVTGTYSAGISSIVAGSASFDPIQPATTSQLIVSNGTLSGGGLLQVQQNFEWIGGALTGTGETRIEAGATALLDGNTKVLTERTLSLAGAATWHAGDIFSGKASKLSVLPGGVLTVPGNVGFQFNQGSPMASLANAGSVETSGAVTVSGSFDNAGGLLVNAGTLKLQGGGTWSGDRIVGVGPGAVADVSSGTFVVERNLTSMGTQAGIGTLRFSGADFQVNGTYQIIGVTEVTAGRVGIAQNFDVNGRLTHSGGLIDVKGNVTFAGEMQALGGGRLDIGGNFSHTGNGDNQRMIGTVAHVTRFLGDATGGRILEWNVSDQVQPSSFGQLELATTGAEGVVLATKLPAAAFVARHLLVRSNALLRVPASPRFVLQFGGDIGFGLVIETGGTFDNSFSASTSVVNDDGLCGTLVGLLRGQLSCLTVR